MQQFHTTSTDDDLTTLEITRSLGGIMCNCSPGTNGHTTMPIAPAGMCPFCGAEGPLYQQALRHAQATGKINGLHGIRELDVSRETEDKPGVFTDYVDWAKAFEGKPDRVEWLEEPILERGTLNALYGAPGVGKSLFALWTSAKAAYGGRTILYVDSENNSLDLADRLSGFGYKPEQLKTLHLLSFSSIAPLDTPAGGAELRERARQLHADLVVIDTASRFIRGKENDADTYLSMYRHTHAPLKGDGVTQWRLDHPGKDADKGQRGSSAKVGDCDTIWKISMDGHKDRLLEREKSRNGHGADRVLARVEFNPFRFDWVYDLRGNDMDPESRYREVSSDSKTRLEQAGITADMTVRQARDKLTESNIKMNNTDLSRALKELKSGTEQNSP